MRTPPPPRSLRRTTSAHELKSVVQHVDDDLDIEAEELAPSASPRQVLGFPAYLGSVSSWPLVLALTLIPATLQAPPPLRPAGPQRPTPHLVPAALDSAPSPSRPFPPLGLQASPPSALPHAAAAAAADALRVAAMVRAARQRADGGAAAGRAARPAAVRPGAAGGALLPAPRLRPLLHLRLARLLLRLLPILVAQRRLPAALRRRRRRRRRRRGGLRRASAQEQRQQPRPVRELGPLLEQSARAAAQPARLGHAVRAGQPHLLQGGLAPRSARRRLARPLDRARRRDAAGDPARRAGLPASDGRAAALGHLQPLRLLLRRAAIQRPRRRRHCPGGAHPRPGQRREHPPRRAAHGPRGAAAAAAGVARADGRRLRHAHPHPPERR